MDAFLARQPILNRDLQLHGYELLFRNGAENYFRTVDGDVATASLISDAVHIHSLEKLTDGHMTFINFTRNALVQDLYTVLPQASTVVEVLESVAMDDELLKSMPPSVRAHVHGLASSSDAPDVQNSFGKSAALGRITPELVGPASSASTPVWQP